MWTVKRVLEWTTEYLGSKGCDTPRLDAEVLLGHCLDLSRVGLYLNYERPLSNTERDSYRKLVVRRACREPVSLIIGRKEFWSLPFKVMQGVLIPRPDTETLVEVTLREMERFPEPNILEIGVGTGAVSICLLHENPRATVFGVDINPLAIELSVLNAGNLGLKDRFLGLQTDMTVAFRNGPLFDIIISNPPYIPSCDIERLAPEIVRFEPVSALNGGPEGLDIIHDIIANAPDFLSQSGCVILEIGDNQSKPVESMFEANGRYTETDFFRDLSGKIRVVRAQIK